MDATNHPSTIVEHIADWHTGLTVDRHNRVVCNVALAGSASKNGYRYTEQALREAASLYEQKPVFLDHALDKSRPHMRSARDLVGTIVNPRYESGRIRSDIRVLDTDSGRTFLALSESDTPGVGMSHVVLAQRSAADGAVERIHDVVSVDAVVFPATTRTFRESLGDSADESGRTTSTAATEETAAACQDGTPEAADLSEDATPESQHAPLHQQLQQLLTERDELLARLRKIHDREEAESRARDIQNQIDAAGLPAYAVTDEFRRMMLQADDATWAELIAERWQLIATARCQPPRSAERSMSPQPADVDAVFVAAIRRHAS